MVRHTGKKKVKVIRNCYYCGDILYANPKHKYKFYSKLWICCNRECCNISVIVEEEIIYDTIGDMISSLNDEYCKIIRPLKSAVTWYEQVTGAIVMEECRHMNESISLNNMWRMRSHTVLKQLSEVNGKYGRSFTSYLSVVMFGDGMGVTNKYDFDM